MTELKFRAWDILTKKMFFPYLLQLTKDGEVVVIRKGKTSADQSVYNGHGFELMQWTGFVDNCGKEIYERDIVRVIYVKRTLPESWFFMNNKVAEIEFDDGGFRLFCPGHYIRVESKFKLCDLSKDVDCEVIGNIYQNPELLKP